MGGKRRRYRGTFRGSLMTTYWEEFGSILEKIRCEWCHSTEDVYDLEGEKVCRECLQSEEVPDQTHLSDEERN